MCTSIIHAVFNLVLLVSASLLLASLLTPAWQYLEPKEGEGGVTVLPNILGGETGNEVISRGVLIKNCVLKLDACAGDYWETLQAHEKITAGLLIVAIVCCTLALVWSCVMFFACCCKSCLVTPLPILCTLALGLDVAAVVVYTLQEADGFEKFAQGWRDLGVNLPGFKSQYGYSMYLAVIGGVGLVVNVGLSIALMCCTKTSPV